MGVIVMVRGSLRGMGHEAECEVVAIKRIMESTQESRPRFVEEYSEFGVVEAPADLPDGEYTLSIGNQTFSTTRRRGLWLSICEKHDP